MKSALISIIVLSIGISVSAQNNELSKNNQLPKAWTKDFKITYTFGGSMDGSNTRLTFTYDSCIYIRNTGMTAPKTTVFLLTEADRTEILNKMRELKIDKAKSEASHVPVNDGWSSLLCVGYHCIDDGTSATMSDSDDAIFSAALSYLQSFAAKHDKK